MIGDYSIGSAKWPGLSKLVEEMGEVQQVVGKLLGTGGAVEHWDGTNLRDRLESELGDLLAAISFVVDANGLNELGIMAQAGRKRELFQRWHAEQR